MINIEDVIARIKVKQDERNMEANKPIEYSIKEHRNQQMLGRALRTKDADPIQIEFLDTPKKINLVIEKTVVTPKQRTLKPGVKIVEYDLTSVSLVKNPEKGCEIKESDRLRAFDEAMKTVEKK